MYSLIRSTNTYISVITVHIHICTCIYFCRSYTNLNSWWAIVLVIWPFIWLRQSYTMSHNISEPCCFYIIIESLLTAVKWQLQQHRIVALKFIFFSLSLIDSPSNLLLSIFQFLFSPFQISWKGLLLSELDKTHVNSVQVKVIATSVEAFSWTKMSWSIVIQNNFKQLWKCSKLYIWGKLNGLSFFVCKYHHGHWSV